MSVDGGLDPNKRLTNHSTRKHLVQKLRDSGIAPTDIMQISGHKNIQSVMNYSEMSEEKHRQCSKILASAHNPTTSKFGQQNQKQCELENVNLPLPLALETCNETRAASSKISLKHGSITMNTQMNSLFAGATLNIQNFNITMKQ